LSFAYGARKSEEENFKVLSRAADIGVTFWDTADVYGFGHNEGIAFCIGLTEELIGKWFKSTGRREDIFLATKFGSSLDGDHTIRTTPEYVKEACDASLKRLQIPQIDLYYMHRFQSPHLMSLMKEPIGRPRSRIPSEQWQNWSRRGK